MTPTLHWVFLQARFTCFVDARMLVAAWRMSEQAPWTVPARVGSLALWRPIKVNSGVS